MAHYLDQVFDHWVFVDVATLFCRALKETSEGSDLSSQSLVFVNLLLNCLATTLVKETVVLFVDGHALFDLSQKHSMDEALMEDVSCQRLVGLTKPFILAVIVGQISDTDQDRNVTVVFPSAILYDFNNALYEDIACKEVTDIKLIILNTGG